MERPFLRDVSFYLMSGFWAFYIFWREEIRLGDSLGFLGLYLGYILVVLGGRYIHSRIRTSVPYADLVGREGVRDRIIDTIINMEKEKIDTESSERLTTVSFLGE